MFQWLMTTDLAVFMSETAWAQQAMETVHMIAFSAMIGAIVIADARLLGRGRDLPVDAWWPLVNWIAWLSMLALIISGAIMFAPRAETIAMRTAFQLKMALLVLALLNLIWVQARTARLVSGGMRGVSVSLQAMAVASMALWVAVIIVGRFMYAIDQMLDAAR